MQKCKLSKSSVNLIDKTYLRLLEKTSNVKYSILYGIFDLVDFYKIDSLYEVIDLKDDLQNA